MEAVEALFVVLGISTAMATSLARHSAWRVAVHPATTRSLMAHG